MSSEGIIHPPPSIPFAIPMPSLSPSLLWKQSIVYRKKLRHARDEETKKRMKGVEGGEGGNTERCTIYSFLVPTTMFLPSIHPFNESSLTSQFILSKSSFGAIDWTHLNWHFSWVYPLSFTSRLICESKRNLAHKLALTMSAPWLILLSCPPLLLFSPSAVIITNDWVLVSHSRYWGHSQEKEKKKEDSLSNKYNYLPMT